MLYFYYRIWGIIMRRNIKKLLVLFLLLICVPTVKAAETNQCTYKVRSDLGKIAANVVVSYDIKTDEANRRYVEISIYNITDEIYVSYTYNYEKKKSGQVKKSVYSFDTIDGVYTFADYDINIIKTYTFYVRDVKYGCTNDIRKISLTKPKYNDYSEMDECQYSDVQDYTYCQECITRNFT